MTFQTRKSFSKNSQFSISKWIKFSHFLEDDLEFGKIENLLFEDTLSPGDVFERNFSDMNPRDERNDESHQTE